MQYFGQGYPHGGDPLRNVIPTVVVPDTSRYRNMARYQPYYFLGDDFAYGNTDEDELQLPDVAVGRWPFSESEDVLVAVQKLMHYMSCGYSGSYFNVGLFAGDMSHNYYGEGAVVRGMASDIAAALQSVGYAQTLRAADWPDPDVRRQVALNLWHYPTELAVMVSTGASRYNAADFFEMPNFNVNMLQYNNWTPIVIGASCGMGEFARTEDPHAGYQRPLMQRFLAAYGKGAIGWCGPSAGTWQLGNDAVATTIAEYIAADPTRPAGESVRLALRDVIENADPVRDAAVVKTARSYGYFGFPLCPVLKRPYASEVRGETPAGLEFSVASGTPSGSPVEFVLSLPARGRVLARAYDITGRVVSRVWDGTLDPGIHRVRWPSGADGERSVAAGVYWVRMDCPSGTVTRRVTIVK